MPNDSRAADNRSVQTEPGLGGRFLSFDAIETTLLVSGVLEALITLRILLKLIGANPESLIVALFYGFTSLLLIPWVELVDLPTLGGTVLEISSMFAIIVCALVALAMERLIWVIFSRPRDSIIRVAAITPGEHHTIP